ncbi:MAG: AAA family ATPase [Desulfovibrionaceae bacterium]|nr:AAA family ATPase [Desulfovibrionaceae bacterium]
MNIEIDDIERIPGIEIFTGSKLKLDIEYESTLPHRDCFKILEDYLSHPTRKILLLSGLRRTGKTVLQKQGIALLSAEDFSRAVRMNISEESDLQFDNITCLCQILYERGFRWFFIDEASAALNFPEYCKELTDTLASYGCHLVLTGTNSLAMYFAKLKYLEGRYEEIKTTRIPFGEWSRLVSASSKRDNDLFDYMRYGGVLDSNGVPSSTALSVQRMHSFKDINSVDFYTYSAIALNLQNSIARHVEGKEFGVLRGLYDSNVLTNAIMRMITLHNYPIAINSMNESFKFYDVTAARESLQPKFPFVRSVIVHNSKQIKDDIAERLNIDNNSPRITKEESQALYSYLKEMDVFSESKVYLMASADPEIRKNQNLYRERTHILQTQIGIRYAQVQLALDSIWEVLRVHGAKIAYNEFDRIAGANARGRIMEDVLIADISELLPKGCSIFKVEWQQNEAEFDIAIVDNRASEMKISLLEVKHNDEYRSEYTKYFRKDDILNQIEEAFGKIVSKKLIYNGGNGIISGVQCVNATEFLRNISSNIESVFD